MTAVILGQILGLSLAAGLNLYITIATLGLLSRFGLLDALPDGLLGLEAVIVIGSALGLYLVEAIVDKIRHADSLWDTIHTFIRPPAAALLVAGALWAAPGHILLAGASLAFLLALAAHSTKAGLRVAFNTGHRPAGSGWISLGEDLAAVAFAITAIRFPTTALAAGAVALLLILVFGPRLWRAFGLGFRCLAAWLRSLFGPSRWREPHEMPSHFRALLERQPIGTAPPRGTRAGLHGLPGVGAYRSGWLVVTADGPRFLYRTAFGSRSATLPATTDLEIGRGIWADLVHASANGTTYTLFLLKDGPAADLAVGDLRGGG